MVRTWQNCVTIAAFSDLMIVNFECIIDVLIIALYLVNGWYDLPPTLALPSKHIVIGLSYVIAMKTLYFYKKTLLFLYLRVIALC